MDTNSNQYLVTWFLISFIIGIGLFYGYCFFPTTTKITLLIIMTSLLIYKRILIAALLGVSIGLIIACTQSSKSEDIKYNKYEFIDGTASTLPQKTSFGYLQRFDINYPIKGSVPLFTMKAFEPGTNISMSVKFTPEIVYYNPGGYSSSERLIGKITRIYSRYRDGTIIYVPESWRYRLYQYFNNNFPKDTAALLCAIIIGKNGIISDEMTRSFSHIGLAHLLCISGTHLGLISILMFGIFRSLIHALPFRILNRLTAYITPKKASAILTIPFMILYLFMSGFTTPAIRSYIMISLSLWGYLLGRKRVWLNSILFAAFIILVLQPEALLTISFQLSFLAVLFIGLAVNRSFDKESEQAFISKSLSYLRETFLVTNAALLGTLPIIMYVFHYIPLISPISNVISVPILCLIILPMAFLGSLIYLTTGWFPFSSILYFITETYIKMVGLLASIPYASIPVRQFPIIFIVLMYAGLLLFFSHRLRRISLIILSITFVLILSFYFISGSISQVTFLSVGDGDAAVIETKNKTIVMDTGKSGKEVRNYLIYKGKDSIDAIILSHAESDHFGGLGLLLKNFNVKAIMDNGHVLYSEDMLKFLNKREIVVKHLSTGDVINDGRDISMTILNPDKTFVSKDKGVSDNNYALVIKVILGQSSFLFTGDIEEEAETRLLRHGEMLSSTVLKVAHHGSITSSESLFIKYVSPKAAVISVRENSPFKHPSPVVVKRLEGSKIFRTDRDGAIVLTPTKEGLKYKTYRNALYKVPETFTDELDNIKKLFTVWENI